MAGFLEILFPVDISWGVTGGMEFKTDIAVVESGQEVRNVTWAMPRGHWDVSAGIRTAADYATLLAFFNVVQGRAYGFRFKDWSDYTDGGIGLVLSDGTNNRLYKRYTFSGQTFDRMIEKPTGSIVLAGGGSCSGTTGIVTGGTVSTAWTGSFDVPARFDTDKIALKLNAPGSGSWENISRCGNSPHMKTISSGLNTHLAGEVSTLATMIKFTAPGGTTLGFTTHVQDLTFESQLYTSLNGGTPSAAQLAAGLNVDTTTFEGVLATAGVSDADIRTGLWDHTTIDLFLVNYLDLSQGAVKLARGRMGQLSVHRSTFESELRTLLQFYATQFIETYQPGCQAELGDARCTVDLGPLTVTGTVTSVINNRIFADTSRTEDTGTFDNGLLTWTGGLNDGASMEVKMNRPSADPTTVTNESHSVPASPGPYTFTITPPAGGSLYRLTRVRGTVSGDVLIPATGLPSPGTYTLEGSVITVDAGLAGLSMQVSYEYWAAGGATLLELILKMPHLVQVGDTYSLTPGCTKDITACRDRYDNIVNFRGFPYIPQKSELHVPIKVFNG